MKTLITITALGVLFVGAGRLESQGTRPQSPEQALMTIKASNAALLDRQKATLEKLDTLSQDADQLRIFTKRG